MSRWDLLDWIRLIGAILLAIFLWICMANRPTATAATTTPAATTAGLAISEPLNGTSMAAEAFTLKGTGTAGEELEIFENGTSLGKVTVGSDGTWSQNVPSSSGGESTYEVKGASGSAQVKLTLAAASAGSGDCTKDFSLSMASGETVQAPFRFGGEGGGKGYTITVKRGDRTVGTKDLTLDSSCGWSYQSNPGAGAISYEVRPMGDSSSEPTGKIDLTVQ